MKIQNYEGLYGDNEAYSSNTFIHCEALETRSNKHGWFIREHFHTSLFQLFYVKNESGILFTEEKMVQFSIPCLLIIPENNSHGFKFQKNTQGTVLTISVDFIEKIYGKKPAMQKVLENIQIIHLEEIDNWQNIELILEKLSNEILNSLPFKDFKIEMVLNALMIDIYRLSIQNKQNLTEQNNRSLIILREFQKMIRQSQNPQKMLTTYAKDLGISLVHLNRVCKTVIGKTAIQMVHEHYINQAKNYLNHTLYSISEVAYQLNFNDVSYFSRLFKNITGKSPKEFRQNAIQER